MKSKLLVLTLAPAMIIAVSRLPADDTTTEAAGTKPPAKHQQEMLARFDTDGDGKLSEDEKAAAKAAMQERKGEMREEMLARFDANGDGTLDDTERAAARETGKKHRGGQQLSDEQRAKMRAEFEAYAAKYDKDGDGKLSHEERKTARDAFATEHPEAAAKMRAAVDKDGDGTVSNEERRAAAKEMRKKRKAGGGTESGGASE